MSEGEAWALAAIGRFTELLRLRERPCFDAADVSCGLTKHPWLAVPSEAITDLLWDIRQRGLDAIFREEIGDEKEPDAMSDKAMPDFVAQHEGVNYEVSTDGIKGHEHKWHWAERKNSLVLGRHGGPVKIGLFFCTTADCQAAKWAKVRWDADQGTYLPIGKELEP